MNEHSLQDKVMARSSQRSVITCHRSGSAQVKRQLVYYSTFHSISADRGFDYTARM